MKLRLRVNGFPPTVNHIWKSVGRQRFKSAEYQKWEVAVHKAILQRGDFPFWKALEMRPYRLTIFLCRESWRTSKGTIIRPDTPNFEKAAEDAVCRIYGWEDAWNISTRIVKVETPLLGVEPYTEIVFKFLDQWGKWSKGPKRRRSRNPSRNTK